MLSEEAFRQARNRWILLVALALIPALHAALVLGRIHPDEVYQVLEPAFARAHGYGFLPWEWDLARGGGIRNWAAPLFFAALLKVCAMLGIDDPRAYRAVLELPQFGLHLAMLWAVFRYVRRRVDDDRWALLGVALVALHGLVVLFAGRTMSESFSAAFLVLAVEAVDRAYHGDLDGKSLRNAGLLAGLWLGMAVVARYGSAVMVAALLLYIAATRRWRMLPFTVASGATVALLLGALDWVTWGVPFYSLVAYLKFNVTSGQAARSFGEAPWTFYVPWLVRELPIWAWPALLAGFLKERPRVSPPVVAAAAYCAVIFATPHKEERFLYPAIVLLTMAAAPGAVRILRWLPNVQLRVLACAACVGLGLLPTMYKVWPPDLRGDRFRAIAYATRGDATGLLIVDNEGVWWGAGGNFYIGRNIPWRLENVADAPRFVGELWDPRINRAITLEDRAVVTLLAAGFRQVHQIGREKIFAR